MVVLHLQPTIGSASGSATWAQMMAVGHATADKLQARLGGYPHCQLGVPDSLQVIKASGVEGVLLQERQVSPALQGPAQLVEPVQVGVHIPCIPYSLNDLDYRAVLHATLWPGCGHACRTTNQASGP